MQEFFGVNLTINTGSDFESNFNIVRTSSAAFDLTGYSGSAQLAKSVAIGATIGAVATFNVGFTSAAVGKIKFLGFNKHKKFERRDMYMM